MKKILLLFIYFISFNLLIAQNNNVDGVSIAPVNVAPHSSAMLDVVSNEKGMLIPRMTSVQRDAIVNPADGLQIFVIDNNITQKGYWFYDGEKKYWARYGIDIEVLVPLNIVVAFDLNTCPTGWTRFEQANGRFIAGLGNQDWSKPLLKAEGESEVLLDVGHLPKHNHAFSGSATDFLTASPTSHNHKMDLANTGTSKNNRFENAGYNRGKEKKITQDGSGNNTTKGSTTHPINGTINGTSEGGDGLKDMPKHENKPPYVTLIYCTPDKLSR